MIPVYDSRRSVAHHMGPFDGQALESRIGKPGFRLDVAAGSGQ
jgi:hypothetical protein